MTASVSVSAPSGDTARGAVSIDDVTKRFGGTLALDRVSLDVAAGSVHALLGSNGSGKSTLVKMLAGVHQATSGGEIQVDGVGVPSVSITPADSDRLGFRFVHQQLGLFPQLSIADNFASSAGFGARTFSSINRKDLAARTEQMLHEFGIDADPRDRVDQLRPSTQTLVAIGRAMADADRAKVLILDEPTESLPEDETQRLLASIRELAASGMTFMIVSHRLAEIAEVSDHATVLRDGRLVASAPIGDLSRAALIEHITGRSLSGSPERRRASSLGQTVLAAKGLSVGSNRNLSFELREGEVLGVAGLIGSGRSALLEGLFGAREIAGGEIIYRGRARRFGHPGEAVRAGLALVPESRAAQALFPALPVEQNITAATVGRFVRRGSISKRREADHARSRVRDMSIKAASVAAPISTLSGGNQQKAIIARWFDTDPTVLLLDEPTQGVDVGARDDIHRVIKEAVAGGMSVILVSSDLDELSAMSDRVLVLRRGHEAEELTDDLTAGRIAALMHDSS